MSSQDFAPTEVVFPFFIDELEKYSHMGIVKDEFGVIKICPLPTYAPQAWLHELYPPLKETDIAALEEQLQITFSQDYYSFLKMWNGAALFFGSVVIWGRKLSRVPEKANPSFDLLKDNKIQGHQTDDLPPENWSS